MLQILENELLTELSEKQQEMVTGGSQGITKAIGTFYHMDSIKLIEQVGSGPDGSFVNIGLEQSQVTTGSSEMLNADFFGGWPNFF